MPTQITLDDLDDLAIGAALLGTGGGGDPYIGKLIARAALEKHGPVTLLGVDEVPDDASMVAVGTMGAPTILIEKLPAGDEVGVALDAYEAHVGRKITGVVPFEAGGLNCMVPMAIGASRGLPVVDGDGMGRAFPQLEMVTFNVYGASCAPIALADEHGTSIIISTQDSARGEMLARAATIKMGGQSALISYGMDGATVRRCAVPGTISLALSIGRAIRRARDERRDAIADLIAFFEDTHYGAARLLVSGKIEDVSRREKDGWSLGEVTIKPFDAEQAPVTIQIQNENLMAEQGGAVLAIVPDLVTILDRDTSEPITTERLHYGQRVNVLGIRVPELMRTPEALAVFGPQAFGLPHAYSPLQSRV
jgi:DUF917 family protein